jgi:hypothetical protein
MAAQSAAIIPNPLFLTTIGHGAQVGRAGGEGGEDLKKAREKEEKILTNQVEVAIVNRMVKYQKILSLVKEVNQ